MMRHSDRKDPSVIFTKLEEGRYSVDFCQLGTYDRVYNTNDEDDDL